MMVERLNVTIFKELLQPCLTLGIFASCYSLAAFRPHHPRCRLSLSFLPFRAKHDGPKQFRALGELESFEAAAKGVEEDEAGGVNLPGWETLAYVLECVAPVGRNKNTSLVLASIARRLYSVSPPHGHALRSVSGDA